MFPERNHHQDLHRDRDEVTRHTF